MTVEALRKMIAEANGRIGTAVTDELRRLQAADPKLAIEGVQIGTATRHGPDGERRTVVTNVSVEIDLGS